jgi:hypothetical protein
MCQVYRKAALLERKPCLIDPALRARDLSGFLKLRDFSGFQAFCRPGSGRYLSGR